jgi:DNA-binding transcriptional MerR regulator
VKDSVKERILSLSANPFNDKIDQGRKERSDFSANQNYLPYSHCPIMPLLQRPIEKVYFSIGEVAEMFDVNTSLIRFWEKEFPQLQPRKNARGNRVYSKKDVELFEKIHHLVKDKGFTLDGAKNALRQVPVRDGHDAVMNKLLRIRKELQQIAASL